MQEGIVNPAALEPCTGTYVAPEDTGHHVWHNWDPTVNQGMALPTALAYSCDTYFYRLGNAFYLLPPDRGQPEQRWARAFGFGQQAPIEIGPQASGLLPTIGWKHRTFTHRTDPTNWQIDRLWKPGDSIQLAIGQGDLTVTPLQMARFYSAIANGGKLVQPHILLDVENPNKTLVPTPGARRAAAGSRTRPVDPRSRAGGALRGGAHPVRYVVRRLRQLPDADRRQDRHGAEGRLAPRRHPPREPVVVVRLRPVQVAEARRVRRDRERRLRRRRRGAGGGAGVREVLPRQHGQLGHHPTRD